MRKVLVKRINKFVKAKNLNKSQKRKIKRMYVSAAPSERAFLRTQLNDLEKAV